MKEDLKVAIREAVAPHLEVGEEVEVEASAGVGQISLKKMMATALVVGALTLGTVMATSKPRVLYIALTDQRLIFLEPSIMMGTPTSTVVASIPRTALSTVATKGKRVMFMPTLLLDLAVAGSAKGMRLQFSMPVRDEGRRIAEALTIA